MQGAPELSISLGGVTLDDGTREPRGLIAWARGQGVRWVQLDGTVQGVRARDLDRSARRDLASVLRRSELGLSGIDLFIPPRHFGDPQQVDRAVTAAVGAIELAGELRSMLSQEMPRVAIELPAELSQDVSSQLQSSAVSAGVVIADHARPPKTWGDAGMIGEGIDPATLLLRGEDVFDVMTASGNAPVEARLSDSSGGVRVPAGSSGGRLDLVEYAAALGVCKYTRQVVVDLRGIAGAANVAPRVIAAWKKATSVA